MPTFGVVLALVLALGDALKSLPGGSGLVLTALAIVLVGTGALSRQDPREGLAVFGTTLFGAMYVGLLGFVARLVDRRACPWMPPRRSAGSAPSAPGSSCSCCASGPTTRPRTSPAAASGGARSCSTSRRRRPSRASRAGLIAAAVVGAILVLALGRPVLAGLLLGLVVAFAAQAGDLAESMLKRAAGAKESGSLIPGHGGLLDRVDSFLFAAPVAYFFVVADPRLTRARPRRVALLGSTGSIGRQAVEVLAADPSFRVVALAAGSRADVLAEQVERLRPAVVAIADDAARRDLAGAGPARRHGGPRGRRRAARAGDPAGRRHRPRRHGRRRQPPTGHRRARRGQDRGHREQGDARRRRAPRHAPGAGACRGAPRRRSGGSAREPARLASADRLGALRDLAVPRR